VCLTYILTITSLLSSCSFNHRNETNLSTEEIEFISSLDLLDEDEKIEMCESNGGFNGYKQSGNFITNKRLAGYWIADDSEEINFAKYSDIDSIVEVDLISKPTYASYLEIYKDDGTIFKVYVDADSTRTYTFFNQAMENWRNKR
jgi:hypothetical protein